jgi:hypothetical protein
MANVGEGEKYRYLCLFIIIIYRFRELFIKRPRIWRKHLIDHINFIIGATNKMIDRSGELYATRYHGYIVAVYYLYLETLMQFNINSEELFLFSNLNITDDDNDLINSLFNGNKK